MDEFSLIEALRERFARVATGPTPWVDIGDDAAVFAPDPRATVLSVDACVEHVHFKRWYASPRDLGWRAFMAAASDLAAMAAQPESALLAWNVPSDVSEAWLLELAEGVAEAAAATRLRIVGGNLSRGQELSLTTTVIGRLPLGAEACTRSGARAGDDLYVTGFVGAAALGLRAIQTTGEAGAHPLARDDEQTVRVPDRFATWTRAWRRPHARLEFAHGLQARASAAVDISDGLLQDLGHLCRASQVGAELALEALPTSPAFLAACHELGTSAEACTLRGGEDYELLFASSPEHREAWLAESSGTPLRRIGQLVHAPGVTLVEPNGTRRNPSREDKGPAGFRHF